MAKMSEEQRAELVRARQAVALQETGAALASRALAWGTLYAVGGCGILFFSIWKMMGVQNMSEFRQKVSLMSLFWSIQNVSRLVISCQVFRDLRPNLARERSSVEQRFPPLHH